MVLIRRVWLGDPPGRPSTARPTSTASYTSAAAQQHWRDNGFLCRDDAGELAADLSAAVEAAGATCLNLRVHVPGVSPEMARAQITALGEGPDHVLRHPETFRDFS